MEKVAPADILIFTVNEKMREAIQDRKKELQWKHTYNPQSLRIDLPTAEDILLAKK